MSLTISTLAGQYFRAFEEGERTDGTRFWKRRDTCQDDDLKQLCFDAHDDMMPDDHKYRFIVDALAILADYAPEEADEHIEADIYTHDLTAWLHSNISRVYYLTEALESYAPKDGFQLLSIAQYMERSEVFSSVLASLHTIVAERNGED